MLVSDRTVRVLSKMWQRVSMVKIIGLCVTSDSAKPARRLDSNKRLSVNKSVVINIAVLRFAAHEMTAEPGVIALKEAWDKQPDRTRAGGCPEEVPITQLN